MTQNQTRLVELLDRLQATLDEIRACLREDPPSASAEAGAVEAFADEAFRSRDA